MGPDDLNLRDALAATATATNATATATGTTPAAGQRGIAFGVLISFQGAAVAAATATLKSGTNLLFNINIPAAVPSPIVVNFPRPVKGNEAEALVLSVPALGASVVCSPVLFYRLTGV